MYVCCMYVCMAIGFGAASMAISKEGTIPTEKQGKAPIEYKNSSTSLVDESMRS